MRQVYELDSGSEPWVRAVANDRDTVVSDLFSLHHRRLVGLASLLVDDRRAAEDVVQEAFVALYRRRGQLRDPDAALAFLNKEVVNGGRDSGRARSVQRRRVLVRPP